MRRLAPAEPHFYFDLVTFLEEAAGRSDPNLQVVLVGARSDAHLLDLGDVLILLGIAGTLVLLETELSQVSDPAHGRTGATGDFDEIEAGLLGTPQCLVDGEDPYLLAVFIDDADFWNADLGIGARTGRDRRT